jgi:hypothetical protein
VSEPAKQESKLANDFVTDESKVDSDREFLFLPDDGLRGYARTSITESARQIFGALGRLKSVFYREGDLCRVVDGQLEHISAEQFRSVLEDSRLPPVALMKITKGESLPIVTNCSNSHARALIASDEARSLLPNIQLVTRSPVLYEDSNGELRETVSGWNGVNGGLYQYSNVKAELCTIEEADKIIRSLIPDFEFQEQGDRSRFIAAILTPALVMGGFIKGSIPMLVCEADQSQSGKTYAQKVLAAIYGEKPHVLAQKDRGGVGSLDESFGQALVFDNVRGKLGSKLVEAVMTADGPLPFRVLRKEVEVDPKGRFFMLSSNGYTTTRDLANRSFIVRIKKRPGREWHAFPEGDLLDHVRANTGRVLGAIFAIVRDWWQEGKQRTVETRHDFRDWCRVLDWIVKEMGECPLMDGHQELQTRQSTEGLALLRQIAIAVEESGSLGDDLTTSGLVDIVTSVGVEIGGGDKPAQWIGRLFGPIFRETDSAEVDGITVTRDEEEVAREDGNGTRRHFSYVFERKKR